MNEEREKYVQEEVDLRFLYRKIRQFFSGVRKSFVNLITNILLILRKRWGLILLFGILGAGAGAGYYYTITPVYTSTVVLTSSALTNEFCSDMITNLDLFIRDRTPDALAKKLEIPLTAAREIKKFEFDNYNEKIKKKYDNMDTVVLGLPFRIRVYALNNTVFDTIQPALIHFLENNEYALKRKKIRIANLNSLREKINYNIHQLDSLKLVVASNMFPRGTQNGFVFGQPLDPMAMFRDGINLFKEDLNINRDLILSDNIQVIENFSPRAKPDYPRLRTNVPVGGATGFVFGIIFAFYLERKKLKLASA